MRRRIDSYISHLSINRRLSEATLRAYSRDLELYETFLNTEGVLWSDVDGRTARNFLSWLSALGYSSTGINRTLSAVRGFYGYWLSRDEVDVNPFDVVRGLKKKSRLPGVMASSDLKKLFAAVPGGGFSGTRDRLIFELLYSTGCRISEAVGINLGDFSNGSKSLKVRGKGRKERIVFMGERAREALAEYLPCRKAVITAAGGEEKERPLFLNKRGGRLTSRGVTHILDGYTRKAGLNGRVSPHTFRHTFATDLLNNGANIREVQEMLGHASLSTTQVYTHVGIENARREYRKAHPHGGGRT